jgi:hypothetical protein
MTSFQKLPKTNEISPKRVVKNVYLKIDTDQRVSAQKIPLY